jgi:hypothetical protein
MHNKSFSAALRALWTSTFFDPWYSSSSSATGIFALFVLIVALLAEVVMRLPSLWNAIRVKHAKDAVPTKWECLGRLPADTTIVPHVRVNPISVIIERLTVRSQQSKGSKACRFQYPSSHACACVPTLLQI